MDKKERIILCVMLFVLVYAVGALSGIKISTEPYYIVEATTPIDILEDYFPGISLYDGGVHYTVDSSYGFSSDYDIMFFSWDSSHNDAVISDIVQGNKWNRLPLTKNQYEAYINYCLNYPLKLNEYDGYLDDYDFTEVNIDGYWLYEGDFVMDDSIDYSHTSWGWKGSHTLIIVLIQERTIIYINANN